MICIVAVVARVVALAKHVALHLFREAVYHGSARVSLLRSYASVDIAKPSLLHTFLYCEVNDSLFLPIVNACYAAEVRLFVVCLHLVDNLRGKILQRHVLVIAEKFLSAHEYLLDSLSVNLDDTIGYFHTGQLLYQVLQHTAFRHLESVSIENQSVLFHLHLFQLSRYHSLFQFNAVWRHHHGAHSQRTFVLAALHVYLSEEIVVADV